MHLQHTSMRLRQISLATEIRCCRTRIFSYALWGKPKFRRWKNWLIMCPLPLDSDVMKKYWIYFLLFDQLLLFRMSRCLNVQKSRCPRVQMSRCLDVQMSKDSSLGVLQRQYLTSDGPGVPYLSMCSKPMHMEAEMWQEDLEILLSHHYFPCRILINEKDFTLENDDDLEG